MHTKKIGRSTGRELCESSLTKKMVSGFYAKGERHRNYYTSTIKNDISDVNRVVGVVLNAEIGWKILDQVDDRLYLAHFNDEADVDKVGHIRGTLVDVVKRRIVCSSPGYIGTVISDVLKPEADNKLHLTDCIGRNKVFDLKDIKFFPGVEGVIFRIAKYMGKVHILTYRRIRTAHSRWGSSPQFISMWNDLGGPKDEEMFNPAFPSSNWCHNFEVVHPSLLIGTRHEVGKGCIVYLDSQQYWTPDPEEEGVDTDNFYHPVTERYGTSSRSFSEETSNSRSFSKETPDEKTDENVSKVKHLPSLTLEEANQFLLKGWYPNQPLSADRRMDCGEKIVICRYHDGLLVELLTVQSESFSYRRVMRENDPNIVHRFYDLVTYSNCNPLGPDQLKNYEHYSKMFIPFRPYTKLELSNILDSNPDHGILKLELAKDIKSTLSTREARLSNIWVNFVFALPHNKQQLALDILETYHREFELLIIKVMTLTPESLKTMPEASKTLIRIIHDAHIKGHNAKSVDNKFRERKVIDLSKPTLKEDNKNEVDHKKGIGRGGRGGLVERGGRGGLVAERGNTGRGKRGGISVERGGLGGAGGGRGFSGEGRGRGKVISDKKENKFFYRAEPVTDVKSVESTGVMEQPIMSVTKSPDNYVRTILSHENGTEVYRLLTELGLNPRKVARPPKSPKTGIMSPKSTCLSGSEDSFSIRSSQDSDNGGISSDLDEPEVEIEETFAAVEQIVV